MKTNKDSKMTSLELFQMIYNSAFSREQNQLVNDHFVKSKDIKINFFKLKEKYPIDIHSWGKLIADCDRSKAIEFILILPLIEHYLGRAATSWKEVEESYRFLLLVDWPKEVLLFQFRYSFFVRKETHFFELLNRHNTKLISEDLSFIETLFLESTKEMQKNLLRIMDETVVDFISIKYISWLFSALDSSLRLILVKKLGIENVVNKLQLEHDLLTIEKKRFFSGRLFYFMQLFDTSTQRLQFFRMLPVDIQDNCITSVFLLKEFIALFNEEHRMILARNELKTIVPKLHFTPHSFASVAHMVPKAKRAIWLKELFTREQLAELRVELDNPNRMFFKAKKPDFGQSTTIHSETHGKLIENCSLE